MKTIIKCRACHCNLIYFLHFVFFVCINFCNIIMHTACDSMQSFINFFIHFFYYLFAFFIGLFMYCHQPVNQAPLFYCPYIAYIFCKLVRVSVSWRFMPRLFHKPSIINVSRSRTGTARKLQEDYIFQNKRWRFFQVFNILGLIFV